jgi:cyclase
MKTTTIMRPWLIVSAACAFAAASIAQDQDFSKVQMKVSKVAGNVYIFMGAGGNIGASVGDDGIVIVDDQYAPLADKIQAALKGITDKPAPHDAFPILTFDHDVTVHLNGEDIRALYFPAGHTDGDSIIFFPKSNVVHMGR